MPSIIEWLFPGKGHYASLGHLYTMYKPCEQCSDCPATRSQIYVPVPCSLWVSCS